MITLAEIIIILQPSPGNLIAGQFSRQVLEDL